MLKLRKDKRRTNFFLQTRLFGSIKSSTYQIPLVNFEKHVDYVDALNIDYPSSYHYLSYPKSWTPAVRERIRKRDDYTCQVCGCMNDAQKNGYNDYSRPVLDVHHIDYNRHNLAETNLITACHSCHSKTNTNRTSWRLWFERKIISIYKEKQNGNTESNVRRD